MDYFLCLDDNVPPSKDWSPQIINATAFATQEDATSAIWTHEVLDATQAVQYGDGWYIVKKTCEPDVHCQPRRRTYGSGMNRKGHAVISR